MFRKLLAAAFLLVCAGTAMAQDTLRNNYPLSLGPFITFKAGVNAADVPEGIQNGVAFNGFPDFGAILYVPIGSQNKIGVLIEPSYSTYAFVLKPYNNPDNSAFIQKLGYAALGVEMYLYGFTIGFNALMNASYSAENRMINEEALGGDIEFRLGGMIPIYADENGRVNLMIRGGYFLTGALKDGYFGGFNLHPASLEFGVNYLFNLKK